MMIVTVLVVMVIRVVMVAMGVVVIRAVMMVTMVVMMISSRFNCLSDEQAVHLLLHMDSFTLLKCSRLLINHMQPAQQISLKFLIFCTTLQDLKTCLQAHLRQPSLEEADQWLS